MKIYAAVIEWPDNLLKEPTLITARDNAGRMAQLRDEIANTLAATVPECMAEFRAAFTQSPADFIDAAAETGDGPIITFYTEREV